MVRLQRELAREGGVVVAGRDIGTVVLPGAQVKVFLTASLEERARRRYRELRAQGWRGSLEQVKRDVQRRDEIDSTREVSPLRPAPDAIVLDTEGLSIEQVVEQVVQLAQKRGS
jgi:cytidylate kinase